MLSLVPFSRTGNKEAILSLFEQSGLHMALLGDDSGKWDDIVKCLEGVSKRSVRVKLCWSNERATIQRNGSYELRSVRLFHTPLPINHGSKQNSQHFRRSTVDDASAMCLLGQTRSGIMRIHTALS
jgi:hypothetical protein